MADAGPQPLPAPWPQTRPRRTPQKPKVTYRRSPGAVSRPVPRPIPSAGTAGRVLSGLARFIPFRAFADLFFGGVQRNSERLAATEQFWIDYQSERGTSRLARGTERRVSVSRSSAARYSTPVLPEVLVSRAATADRVVPKPSPLPEPVLANVGVSSVALGNFSPDPRIFPEAGGVARPPAGPQTFTSPPQKLLEHPPFQPFFTRFSTPLESPLLTPFKPPGVASSPLARPELLAEPLPEAESQRCRCRAPKRKAGKPGKGFFTINRRGEERRQYWR